jgi:hypothetical protein
MKVIDMPLLLASAAGVVSAQDPLELLPNNYRLAFENESVRAVRVVYAPMEKLPTHDHPKTPTIYVYLDDSGPVRFSHREEHPFSLIRPAEKAGAFRYSPGRLEKHQVENLGTSPSDFLRIELRQLRLGYEGASFRSSKIFDALQSGVRNEFERPLIRIDRVIAAAGDATELEAADTPALLIAFSPALIQPAPGRQGPGSLERGDVLWIDKGRSARVRTGGEAPAHLLRIVLPARR